MRKTAYEMRISDWSSDVCSSDLLDQVVDVAVDAVEPLEMAADPVFGQAAVVAHQAQVELRQQLGVVVREDLAEVRHLANFPQQRHRIRRGGELSDQIGRASCRERECQYV